jgi:hypothetical protein
VAVADTTPATVVEATVVTKVAIMEATEATSRTVEVTAVAVVSVQSLLTSKHGTGLLIVSMLV